MLPPQTIPFDADFFTDLGGHSLLAARFISVVRETPALARITLQDVYTARSLRAIGELLDQKWARHRRPRISLSRRRRCCAASSAAPRRRLRCRSFSRW